MTLDPGTISIFLIDDQTLVRAALRALITGIGFRVVGDEGDARTGIRRVAELRPHVIVLDIAMPGLSGIDSVRPLKEASPVSRVLIASQHEGQQFVRQAMEAGADGYISKSAESAELRLAIESVCRGQSFVSPAVSGDAPPPAPGANDGVAPLPNASRLGILTPRERQVFQLLAIGKANKDIAETLELSLGTIKKHRENLQRKLDCHSPADLARLAIREGLLGI
jgi:DNA-binding NarL/FixJ family response regulator